MYLISPGIVQVQSIVGPDPDLSFIVLGKTSYGIVRKRVGNCYICVCIVGSDNRYNDLSQTVPNHMNPRLSFRKVYTSLWEIPYFDVRY